MQRERWRSAPIPDMVRTRDLLRAMAVNDQYTDRTRQLAAIEADYMQDLIAFRMLPTERRRYLISQGISPWDGSWSRYEEPHYREFLLNPLHPTHDRLIPLPVGHGVDEIRPNKKRKRSKR